MNTTTELFKIVAVSKNTNSFGLHGVIILSKSGKGFEIGMGSINNPQRGEILTVRLTERGNITDIAGRSYEIPRTLPTAPQNVVNDVWGINQP